MDAILRWIEAGRVQWGWDWRGDLSEGRARVVEEQSEELQSREDWEQMVVWFESILWGFGYRDDADSWWVDSVVEREVE